MAADPWTVYWQADHLESCVAMTSAADADVVSSVWQRFASSLQDGSAVLDLATGNGTVPRTLLLANPSLAVTGVDQADIDPLQYLSDSTGLTNVKFMAGVDVCALPLAAESFDALTSQFGIEYAPLKRAVPATIPLLKSGGRLLWLLHHAESVVVRPARKKRQEMLALLQTDGTIQALIAHVQGKSSASELELAGKRHLESSVGRSRKVTGQIFEGVHRVLQFLENNNRTAAVTLANTMTSRLQADCERLGQLCDAAIADEKMQVIVEQLQQAGLVHVTTDRLAVSQPSNADEIVGWLIGGSKP